MEKKTIGAFIAALRKAGGLTQRELAEKLNVSDKAVSRWERGLGFPDIHSIEPLAAALDVSVLELIQSERIVSAQVTSEDASQAILQTLKVAEQSEEQQRRLERKNILLICGYTAVLVLFLLFLDGLEWQADAVLLTGAGVAFPIFCFSAFVLLILCGIVRKLQKKPCGQTFLAACLALVCLLLLFASLFLIGMLGLGPVPT